jgi:hypothetical protein
MRQFVPVVSDGGKNSSQGRYGTRLRHVNPVTRSEKGSRREVKKVRLKRVRLRARLKRARVKRAEESKGEDDRCL